MNNCIECKGYNKCLNAVLELTPKNENNIRCICFNSLKNNAKKAIKALNKLSDKYKINLSNDEIKQFIYLINKE